MSALRARFLALFVVLIFLGFGASPVPAQNFENAVAGFTSDSFDDTDAAIAAVAASGNALAEQVITALQGGRLLFSPLEKKVYIREALNNPSLAIEAGEMRAIIGPNGAGKTTTAHGGDAQPQVLRCAP